MEHKEMSIQDIQDLTETEAKEMALESMEIKEHQIYLADCGRYFGYSRLVFKNGRHIYYANDYALHHPDMTKEELRERYIKVANNILFTEEEITGPVKDYSEKKRKEEFLRNYYSMRVPSVSMFYSINPTEREQKEFREKVKGMYYDCVSFCYVEDQEFAKHHEYLLCKLEETAEAIEDQYAYYKDAFLREMYNHEYAINLQADWDVLSAFWDVAWRNDEDLNGYFNNLGLTDDQRRAYLDARTEYYAHYDE